MTPWLGITLGDPSGIGPEVTLKALALLPPDDWRYLLIGPRSALHGSELPIRPFESYSQPGRYFSFDPAPDHQQFPSGGSPEAGRAAVAALREGAARCLRGELAGIVTAPVHKESIMEQLPGFTGQTEFLSELAGSARTAMMLLGKDDRERWLRVALVTTHLPLRAVADQISQAKVELAIELAARSCKDLGLPRARVAVCGLNPHAGEGGHLGSEEASVISPAVEAMRTRGIDVEGPLPADTLFYYAYNGHFDAVVAMYHDQGLAPLKMIGFESGINWTLGLPFIRTSPDHGTAFNIAGQGKANPSSMLAAIDLALRLAKNR